MNLGVAFEGGQVLFGAMRDSPSHAHRQRHAIDHVVVRRRTTNSKSKKGYFMQKSSLA